MRTDLLIIGAGPFGLATAAYAKSRGIDHVVVGKAMDFWTSNMPRGLLLRSACDWHLDPNDLYTIEAYLEADSLTPKDVEPLSLDFYLRYANWFREQNRTEVVERLVEKLETVESEDEWSRFRATLDDGQTVLARNVLLALGFKYFRHVPDELAGIIPERFRSHTCDFVDLDEVEGKRCLVIGGRQSAFEWAALLRENGASSINLSYRHQTPSFEPSDWSWVGAMVRDMVDDPESYQRMAPQERQDLGRRFWAEGRLKLEPWLWPRIDHRTIMLWPESHVVDCVDSPDATIDVTLDIGERLRVDQVILATGYKVEIGAVPFLQDGPILRDLETDEGYPVLDEHMQTSIPRPFVTSMAAARDFGPFFAFTVSAAASSKIVGSFVERSLEGSISRE